LPARPRRGVIGWRRSGTAPSRSRWMTRWSGRSGPGLWSASVDPGRRRPHRRPARPDRGQGGRSSAR